MIIDKNNIEEKLMSGDWAVVFSKSKSKEDAKKIADMVSYAIGLAQYDDGSYGVIIDKKLAMKDHLAVHPSGA